MSVFVKMHFWWLYFTTNVIYINKGTSAERELQHQVVFVYAAA